ncbi:hypothetical protein BLD50_01510 [Bacillus cereus]|nr:hypothetical protein BLD50_01510 [Bacillus cereus]
MCVEWDLVIRKLPASSSAETKYIIPTKKYGEKGTSLEFLSGELTGPSSKSEEEILYQYMDSQKHHFSFGKESVKDSFPKEGTRFSWNNCYPFTTNVSRCTCLGGDTSCTYYR